MNIWAYLVNSYVYMDIYIIYPIENHMNWDSSLHVYMVAEQNDPISFVFIWWQIW